MVRECNDAESDRRKMTKGKRQVGNSKEGWTEGGRVRGEKEGARGPGTCFGQPPAFHKPLTVSDLCEEYRMLRRDHTLQLYIYMCVCVCIPVCVCDTSNQKDLGNLITCSLLCIN